MKKQDLHPVAYYLTDEGEVRKVDISDGLKGLDHMGIQAIAQDNHSTEREVRTSVEGGAYFVERPDGRWFSVDYAGLIDYIIQYCPNIGVGRMLTTDEFSKVKAVVNKDREGHGRPGWERE